MILRNLALGGRRQVTETFTSSQTWVAPAGVTRLEVLVGRGQNGTPDSTSNGSAAVMVVDYLDYPGVPLGFPVGSVDWSTVNGVAPDAVNTLNAGGNGTIPYLILLKYSDGAEKLYDYTTNFFDVIPGSASYGTSGGWQTSGAIHNDGTATAFWQSTVNGTTGAATTGFSQTFPGGVEGAASPVTYNNVPVTPGNSYPLTIPSGGQIQITYLQ
jgi:hypothetical protein